MFSFLLPKPSYGDKIGQSTWLLLHALADHYPLNAEEGNQYEKNITDFVILLAQIYPCAECRAHMTSYFQNFPPRFDNRAHAVRWVLNFHNAVNRRLGKPIFTPKDYVNRLNQYDGVVGDGLCAKCAIV